MKFNIFNCSPRLSQAISVALINYLSHQTNNTPAYKEKVHNLLQNIRHEDVNWSTNCTTINGV